MKGPDGLHVLEQFNLKVMDLCFNHPITSMNKRDQWLAAYLFLSVGQPEVVGHSLYDVTLLLYIQTLVDLSDSSIICTHPPTCSMLLFSVLHFSVTIPKCSDLNYNLFTWVITL